MIKGPCYIARYPGDQRIEEQKVQRRRELIVQVNTTKRFSAEDRAELAKRKVRL